MIKKHHHARCCYCSVTNSYLTLRDLVDSRLPGSSVRGILRARILWSVAMPLSWGSSQTQGLNPVGFFPTRPPGKPLALSFLPAIWNLHSAPEGWYFYLGVSHLATSLPCLNLSVGYAWTAHDLPTFFPALTSSSLSDSLRFSSWT